MDLLQGTTSLLVVAVDDAGGESVSGVCTTGGTHLSWPSLSMRPVHVHIPGTVGLKKILKFCDYNASKFLKSRLCNNKTKVRD